MSSQTFARLLRRFRETAGLSQSALARAARTHYSQLNRVEGGKRGPPKRKKVIVLAKALDLGIDEANQLLLAAGYAHLSESEVGRLGLQIPITAAGPEQSFLRASPFSTHGLRKAGMVHSSEEISDSRLLQTTHELLGDQDLSSEARRRIDEMGAQFVQWLLENWTVEGRRG